MADDKKTQVQDAEKQTQDKDSYEKRYKDSQSHITTLEQENATLREAATKDKELFEAVSPFVNWDAAGGKTATEAVEDDGYVDKKTLNGKIGDLQKLINQNAITQGFRSKYPDMVPYEDLVSVFLSKTDSRRPTEERIGKAVESARKFVESERVKGREEFEKEKKEKAVKEAEASGLSEAKGSKGEERESEGETYEEYVESRKAQSKVAQGL